MDRIILKSNSNDLFHNNSNETIIKCKYNKYFKKWEAIEKTNDRIHHINDLELN